MTGRARLWWSASRRRRRRITWLAILVVVGGSVASLTVWLRNTGTTYTAPFETGQVQVYHEPKVVHLNAQAIHAAQAVTYEFLRTAVLRQHIGDSYNLIAPSLRKGYTRARWAKGEIPVVPYPVDMKKVRYVLQYAYASGGPDGLPYIGLEVAMEPQKGAATTAMRFGIELEAAGKGSRRHWMVSQWGPQGALGGEPQSAPGAAAKTPEPSSLSPVWLLVPAVLLGLILLVPLALGARSWVRHRRIARSYES